MGWPRAVRGVDGALLEQVHDQDQRGRRVTAGQNLDDLSGGAQVGADAAAGGGHGQVAQTGGPDGGHVVGRESTLAIVLVGVLGQEGGDAPGGGQAGGRAAVTQRGFGRAQGE